MKAWCVKGRDGVLWPAMTYSGKDIAERVSHADSTTVVVPVEITEIAEADTVESKEPDWKAMWADLQGVVSKWSEPKYWKLILDEVQRRHTPREKTAEEKLAEVRERVQETLNLGGMVSELELASDILDICK